MNSTNKVFWIALAKLTLPDAVSTKYFTLPSHRLSWASSKSKHCDESNYTNTELRPIMHNSNFNPLMRIRKIKKKKQFAHSMRLKLTSLKWQFTIPHVQRVMKKYCIRIKKLNFLTTTFLPIHIVRKVVSMFQTKRQHRLS